MKDDTKEISQCADEETTTIPASEKEEASTTRKGTSVLEQFGESLFEELKALAKKGIPEKKEFVDVFRTLNLLCNLHYSATRVTAEDGESYLLSEYEVPDFINSILPPRAVSFGDDDYDYVNLLVSTKDSQEKPLAPTDVSRIMRQMMKRLDSNVGYQPLNIRGIEVPMNASKCVLVNGRVHVDGEGAQEVIPLSLRIPVYTQSHPSKGLKAYIRALAHTCAVKAATRN